MSSSFQSRLSRALKAAGLNVTVRYVGEDKSTWLVDPPDQQALAQPIIDAFDPDDPAYEQAELDEQVKVDLDDRRLSSAIVWTILKQMYPTDTDAQTRTKFGVARTRIITAYTRRPWTP